MGEKETVRTVSGLLHIFLHRTFSVCVRVCVRWHARLHARVFTECNLVYCV